MYIAYFDESGDDGFPNYSSDLFVLTSVYMSDSDWKSNYLKIQEFRRQLKENYKLEFHTKEFLTDKNPYRNFEWSYTERFDILLELFMLISGLEIKIINVVIVKPNIQNESYNVLDRAFTYNIQRIENDLVSINPDNKFLIITDDGRVGKMRNTSRRIQRYNPIPSKFHPGTFRKEQIKLLIEDPLPKDSKESYFLQIADAIAYIVYLYSLKTFINKDFAKRVKNVLDDDDVTLLLDIVKCRLNCMATTSNEFGIVNYPKKA